METERKGRPRAVRGLGERARPEGIYASSFDIRVVVRICERLAAGESLRAICRTDASMPTEKTFWNWARRYEAVAEMKAWAMGEARRRALAARDARAAARRAATGRALRPDGYTEAAGEAICVALAEGESLQDICRRPDMPSVGTVYNWLRRHPEFVESYRLARMVQREGVEDAAARRAMVAPGVRAARRLMKAAERRAGRLYPTTYEPSEAPCVLEVSATPIEADGPGWTDVWRLGLKD